jgi:hypothetical protein
MSNDDDIVFSLKTGLPVQPSPRATASNIIPFPRRRIAQPRPISDDNYVERLTIRSSGTFDDIDSALRDELAAIQRAHENDDI